MTSETYQPYTLPQPKSDKALIYFYRQGKLEGSAVGHHFFENGKEIGICDRASFFTLYATPGEHIYELRVPLVPSVVRRLTVKGGQTYYLESNQYVGSISSHMMLSIVNEQEGAAALDHLRMKSPL